MIEERTNAGWSPPLTRREMLSRSGMGLASLGLATLLANETSSAAHASSTSLQLRAPHFAPRAKRVVHFFLNGGPSHVDTFDPKPALQKYAGQLLPQTLRTERKTGAAFPSPFQFRQYGESGIEVSELFAKTAGHVDRMAVIRSMYAQVPNHEPSLMLMNCGDSVQPRPSIGSWVLYGLGTENQNLPGFIAMCPGGYPIKDVSNWQAGFLPGAYQGTYIDSQHQQLERLLENIRPHHAPLSTQQAQLQLIQRLNRRHQESQSEDPRLEARIQAFELAFRMQIEAAEAFDLSQEPAYIHELYGRGVHARQTLIARRLLERGVRYIQLWHGAGQPWDNHDNIEANLRRLAAQIDQPMAALLTDLEQRGMLEETLVIWGGEFGRTPTVELTGVGKSKLGRDHDHYGFTMWLAGGGIRGGTVFGATDEFGFQAVDRPVSVHDLHATILYLLGFDHERLTYRYAGRDFRLTDVSGRILHEIVA
ncbi:MAG: sulfatase [Planctomycetaceae bacterium]|nr:MAG: sulfatase [Planctomycetaceae bacterium]